MFFDACFQAEVYAGSIFVKQILGWDVYLSTCLILAVTAVYTIGGEARLLPRGQGKHGESIILESMLNILVVQVDWQLLFTRTRYRQEF